MFTIKNPSTEAGPVPELWDGVLLAYRVPAWKDIPEEGDGLLAARKEPSFFCSITWWSHFVLIDPHQMIKPETPFVLFQDKKVYIYIFNDLG